MAGTAIAQIKRRKAIEAKRKKAGDDLFFLITEIMHCPEKRVTYDLFTKEYHGPLAQWYDDNRDHKRLALFASRNSYKSYMFHGLILQEIIRDPHTQIGIIHQRQEYAREIVFRVAWHLQHNPRVRELIPKEYRPAPVAKRFYKGTDGGDFRLPGTTGTHPTVRGYSVGQDITGSHPKIIFLDDVISEHTVNEYGGLAGVTSWIQNTVVPVLGATGKLRVTGTTWSSDPEDWYQQILSGKSRFKFIKKAILVDENGEPDKDGQPIPILVEDTDHPDGKRPLNMDDVENFKADALANFDRQYMMNPSPEGDKPWKVDHESYTTTDECKRHLKAIVALVDTSFLGEDPDSRKLKAAGHKDYTSIAVVGYCVSPKGHTIRVLLDGEMHQHWTVDEGWSAIRRLHKKWGFKIVGIEEARGTGQSLNMLCNSFNNWMKLHGGMFERGRVKAIPFKTTQRGKVTRFLDLCVMAKNNWFMINSATKGNPKYRNNPEFLKMFLQQARDFSGKGSIKHDDCIDAVSYLEDPAILEKVSIGRRRPGDDLNSHTAAIAGPKEPVIAEYDLA